MMKPKVALVKSGYLPPGSENVRGRLSKDAIAECKRLVSEEGYKIEGYEISDSQSDESPVVEKKVIDPNRILDIPEFAVRDERDWQAYANINGKIRDIGMRTVCNNCKNSLTYCPCKSAVVNLDWNVTGVVNFKLRTQPLPVRIH